jgi:myo-inositol-1(or 4)-monophosphatase
MKLAAKKRALACAVKAARAAGSLMRRNLGSVKRVNEETQHDIKLELDVRCQKLIERTLRRAFPAISILGEEGVLGDTAAASRWVVDPIDGTVNFTYGIPHACVSIALEIRNAAGAYDAVVGVVYDPFCDELWTAIRGQPARMNGRPIRVSRRDNLKVAIIAMGFAKQKITLNRMLPVFNQLVSRVRKIRIMGAAALSMVWVAAGRLDAYKEYGLRLWDIAAGGLIVECAGGEYWRRPLPGEHAYEILASNGRLRKQLERACR